MRKKFKSKKKFKFKKILYLIIIIILIILNKSYIFKIKLTNSNQNIINKLLNSSNYYSYGETNSNIIDKVIRYIDTDIFNSPVNILKSQIYSDTKKINSTTFLHKNNELPIVYIYNSHQGENYSYKYLEEYNITPNVLMASNMLKDKLENININTLVEEADILKYMEDNDLNHNESYIASRYFLNDTINKYNTIKLYIDLHRDAVSHSVTQVIINGKECAKVLFVVGLEHPNYEKNLLVATKLNNIILEKYSTLTRGIIKKQGYGVNGIYNQDLNGNIILLEIGGNENNIDEINNTLDIIAEVIGEYLNENN